MYAEPLPEVTFYAPIDMPGQPTLRGTRFGAEFVAGMVLDWGGGIAEVIKTYPRLTRAEVLVACWWAGEYGPKRFRKVWSEWAIGAHSHLWYECIRIEDPPRASGNGVAKRQELPPQEDGIKREQTMDIARKAVW